MARRPTPPSSSPRSAPPAQPGRHRRPSRHDAEARSQSIDVREWASGIRLSAFSAIMLSLVVLGTWVLVPTLGTYIEQRQKISALEASVQVSQDEIAALEDELERWDDPAYITTQARERLYYVKPGEVVYLIDDDLDPEDVPREQAPISQEIQERENDWMAQLLRSVAAAGLAQNAVGAD